MRLSSWNVNGLRAAARSGHFPKWLIDEKPDILSLQEIKCTPDQLDASLRTPPGYFTYWHPAKKPGYSGTAIFSRIEPIRVWEGMGDELIDAEGRVLVAEFKDFFLLNMYFPNSQRDHARLPYKLSFCDKITRFCNTLLAQGKGVIICGDFNVAHREIDLKNPKSNINNAGFLPQERAWMDRFVETGYRDSFRAFEPGGGHYSWWSYRPGVREKNVGWRLDYHFVDQRFADKRMKSASIQASALGSDHCPVWLTLS